MSGSTPSCREDRDHVTDLDGFAPRVTRRPTGGTEAVRAADVAATTSATKAKSRSGSPSP